MSPQIPREKYSFQQNFYIVLFEQKILLRKQWSVSDNKRLSIYPCLSGISCQLYRRPQSRAPGAAQRSLCTLLIIESVSCTWVWYMENEITPQHSPGNEVWSNNLWRYQSASRALNLFMSTVIDLTWVFSENSCSELVTWHFEQVEVSTNLSFSYPLSPESVDLEGATV